MAQQGLTVTAVDFVSEALEFARLQPCWTNEEDEAGYRGFLRTRIETRGL